MLIRLENNWRRLLFRKNVSVLHNIGHEKLGSPFAGWYVPMDLINSDSKCYCFGCGEDISFDLALIKRFGCQVFSFDPTPRSIQHVHNLIDNAQQGIPTSINNQSDFFYTVTTKQLERLKFYEYGVWNENNILKFYAPKNETNVSHSLVNLQGTSTYFEARCFTVGTIMEMLKHDSVDVIKLDIEGAEYNVIESFLEAKIRPTVVLVEFDEGYSPIDKDAISRITNTIDMLNENNYIISKIDGWNVTLILQ